LARTAAAPGEARVVVRRRFGDLLAQETMDDVLLVVSELVTNAVLWGAGDVGLHMTFDGRCVSGGVTDSGSAFTPPLLEPDPTRIGGHGLDVVGRVSDDWGLAEDSSRVWFEILAPRGSECPTAV